jgi:hypothetical protein
MDSITRARRCEPWSAALDHRPLLPRRELELLRAVRELADDLARLIAVRRTDTDLGPVVGCLPMRAPHEAGCALEEVERIPVAHWRELERHVAQTGRA